MKTTKLHRKQVNILNINVDSTNERDLLNNIGQKIANGGQIYIVTPNPEIALQAQNDKLLAEIINEADFSVPDGVGFRLVDKNLETIHGRKLLDSLLGLAKKLKLKVFFLGGTPDGIDRAVENVIDKYPGIEIYGEYGPRLNKEGRPVTDLDRKVNNDIVSRINSIKPDFLFVGFGAPKQEKWIYINKGKLKVSCLMTVGGAIDYYAGTTKIPPKWIERFELEWLWRLLIEPCRLGRIINATILFPFEVLASKLPIDS